MIDTHAHLQFADYGLDPDQAIQAATKAGVSKILCVGTDAQSSRLAARFVKARPECFATVGLHPHEAKHRGQLSKLKELISEPKVVAVGECGLDYYYNHSPKADQQAALRYQIELALEHQKPLIFHVRDAFADFFKVIDAYSGIRGVVHSFSSGKHDLEPVLERGLYVGLNGIMTFTKDATQLAAAKAVPRDRLVLETDSPFLTPAPLRGKINEPANVRLVAEFLAKLRGEALEALAKSTTANAERLFGI